MRNRNLIEGEYCDLWLIKCRQGSKMNKSNCRPWKKSTYDWLVDNPSQDLIGQKPQHTKSGQGGRFV
jgi:hypothetical protein